MTDDTWVLEWSKKQNAFHRHPAKVCIEKNLNHFHGDKPSDYIPICIGPKEQCEAVYQGLREKLSRRQDQRGPDCIRKNWRRAQH